jgi:uncharacterized protein (TIGR02246 family)
MGLAVQDQLEILSLVARYCHALDSGDASGVVDTFTEDGLFETPQRTYSGREALERFFQKNVLNDDNERHIPCNHLLSGEADRAAHTCYYQVVFKGRGGIKATGVYEDSVVKMNGIWKFQRRKVIPD